MLDVGLGPFGSFSKRKPRKGPISMFNLHSSRNLQPPIRSWYFCVGFEIKVFSAIILAMSDEEDKNDMKADTGDAAEKLAAAERQRDEYLAGWQRAKADFVNYKREEMAHLQEVARYGSEDLIRDLIGVLDNFDLGLRATEKNGTTVDKGIYLIRMQIEDILRKRGLVKVELKPGDRFDPAVAEAMAEISSDKPEGTIVEEVEPGYRLHDKVIRAARVIVSKGKGE